MLINVLGLNFLLAAKEIAMAMESITNVSQLTEAARLVVVGRQWGWGWAWACQGVISWS